MWIKKGRDVSYDLILCAMRFLELEKESLAKDMERERKST